ncbi:hypothetical protein GO491_04890 [Flavobacteriaceae bacterium Ap0902]|nr:hypothetical protein [Flavobacteriaceae bacterium Ap0902]
MVLLVFVFTTTKAQVVIGDGLTITDGTTMHIQNQEVIINTQEIKGKGKLNIHHDNKQNLNIAKNLETDVSLNITSQSINIIGESKQYFALHFLPSFSNEIIAAKEEHKNKEVLPVNYINFEGKTFKIIDDEKDQNQAEFTIGFEDFSSTIIILETLQIKGVQLNSDYILPIYSNSINNERFSDYAKLYKFECLTALLRPPIV